MTKTQFTCTLCDSKKTALLHTISNKDTLRTYHHCSECDLVFAPVQFHLTAAQEHARYLTHNNDPADPAYRSFLNRLYRKLKPKLTVDSKGLDFGAGPGPALALMMREDGFNVSLYDPYFHPDRNVLNQAYDFIASTETVEHFKYPKKEFELLHRLLVPGGWLGIMTSMLEDWTDFPHWHYIKDPTHISFYSKRTMVWIAQHFGWSYLFPEPNTVLFQTS